MFGAFPEARPRGLRRRSLGAGTTLWRIDSAPPEGWQWTGFPEARSRFDPLSGGFRTRYAAQSVHGAARERYLATGRYIPADHAHHHLVRLTAARALRVLDLRTEANLDALLVDDRISTSREPEVWEACHRLVEAVRAWWLDPDGLAGLDGIDGIVYRSRTTPETSANLAFFSLDGLAWSSRALADCAEELDDLVLNHEFTVGFAY